MIRISIIGTGYVGLVTGACLAEVGHDVVCVDVDAEKVAKINRGVTPIYEPGLEELLGKHAGKKLRATTDLHNAVLKSEITFIAVGTPFNCEQIDLTSIRDAARAIGHALAGKIEYHVVAVKSTVVPGTTDSVVRELLEKHSGKIAGPDFGMGVNPEFIREGVAIQTCLELDRIVLGGIDERTTDAIDRVYAPWKGTPKLRTNNKTAEMIKYAANSMLATQISFANEIGNLCAAMGGVDVVDVMRGVHLARDLNVRQADGKSVAAGITSFLFPGCGFGGSCFPKDVKAIVAHAKTIGHQMPLLDSVLHINQHQPARLIALLEKCFPALKGLRVSVLGLSFKPDTDDMRESPAIPVVEELLHRGAIVKAFDPVALETAKRVLPEKKIEFSNSLEAAVQDVDAVVLVTKWKQFKRLPELLAAQKRPPLFVDGRRMLDKRRFARYAGVGMSFAGAFLTIEFA